MAKTYGELMTEIMASPYSKDMFELEKECAELSILESYIDNQIYLHENFDEDSKIDYMLEAADENNMKSVMTKIREKVSSIGSSIWKLIQKLFELVGRAMRGIVSWFKNKNIKSDIKNAGEKLSSVLNSSSETNKGNVEVNKESTTFTEADEKKDKNQSSNSESIFKAFVKAYNNATKSFDDKIFNKKTSSNIRIIFNNLKIYLGTPGGASYSDISLNDFFKNSNNDNDEIMKNKAKKFIEICKEGRSTIKFEIDNPEKFPIMKLDDYLATLKSIKDKYTSLPAFINTIIKAGIWTGGGFYWWAKATGFFSTIGYAAGTILTVLTILSIYNAVRDKGYYKKDLNYNSADKFEVDVISEASRFLYVVDSDSNIFKKTYDEVYKTLTDQANKYKDAISHANKETGEKIADFLQGKSENGKKIGKMNIVKEKFWHKFFTGLGSIARIKWIGADRWYNPEAASKDYAVFIKNYYQVGANIMTLMTCSVDILNIIYKIAQQINSKSK